MSVVNLSPNEAWKILKENSDSLLIDVRTKEEYDFVGFADLTSINSNRSLFLPWRIYPNMAMNESFTEDLSILISKIFINHKPKNIDLLFICRSGGRSMEAALFMSDFGYNCYNIIGGFEGAIDSFGHRGTTSSWKAENLPWRQN